MASGEQPMSSIPPPAPNRVLGADDKPLVWIDCEMTGLDPQSDRLLEIACIITDGDLRPVDAGVSYVVRVDKSILDSMNEWCIETHGATGLTRDCLSDAAHPHEVVRAAVLAYVLDRVPEARIARLAGSSVHADKAFLVNEMPELVAHLHYRIVDVSSVKELVYRWYGAEHLKPHDEQRIAHRALDDIQASIEELQFYRERVFRRPAEVT